MRGDRGRVAADRDPEYFGSRVARDDGRASIVGVVPSLADLVLEVCRGRGVVLPCDLLGQRAEGDVAAHLHPLEQLAGESGGLGGASPDRDAIEDCDEVSF